FHHPSAQLLAAAARWNGLPVLLPVVDEAPATRLWSWAWAIGPTAEERGKRLATAMNTGPADQVATITSTASDTSFAAGFVTACRVRGATIATRLNYSPGNASFAAEVRTLISQRVSVLFWDGDPNEAALLLRQLTRDRVSLRICGGDGLDPARHHRETRVFLEGVMYVSSDWSLSVAAQSELDRDPAAAGSGPLYVRGWLAGRVAGAALATGVYTPAEVAAAIDRLSPDTGSGLRVLGVRGQGAELPVLSVSDGRALPVQ
ncbi:MAG TPA: ABC transporter substrate-binding protein, partial [Dongiaceae bacterium]|nr:ABC transporter substrate-binding protein [Dongiaceae bacterium]